MTAVDAATVLFATAAATALAGTAVTAVAYRGYRRHDSATMRYLAVGIAFVAVAPFCISYGLAPLAGLDDATTLLAVLCANVVGLLALIYSLDGT
ncbi:hypothetical protein Hbl1158_09215 [Halobaculum sp. CBA1158]|uniref:DUF7521 family protein n=1 Tax=Halobaculum sp. CBA1158 TaxID=2904243 RepID=UPI001F2CC239|nr:hypothetical protein [Halobaculum sp. CBA1158]UIO98726.1 hypothetical protein Hbl1158_09215 [Halobaculum sp. CBA1158]